MNEKDNYLHTAELSEEQNDNMLDGILNNLPPSPLPKGPEKKELDKVGLYGLHPAFFVLCGCYFGKNVV